ncbi:MAG: hypothetical protein JSS20_14425 [Proteobacteria bacterium]|nr:hypothetical protein [Pseudomonadota bacterium]
MSDTTAAKPPLWAKALDYVFGRNTLIGIAEVMLLLIAGYATWHGMHDFIVGVSTSPTKPGGGFSLSNDLLVVMVVVALTFLMWLMLRETFAAKRLLRYRLVTFPLYAFLALWSIGFGYGFWWSLISGEEATRTGLSGLQEDARDAAAAISARLVAVRGNLDSVVLWSDGQMAREETSGGSCGIASGAGRGPLYNARRSVRDSVTALRDTMTKNWLEPVQADIEQLRVTASSLEGGSVEDRQKAFEARASEIRSRAKSIAARSNELGKSTATEMAALAQSVSVAPGTTGFTCHDPTLAERLKQASEQANQPAVLQLREATFNEGPAGVANAVKNLWKNIGTYASALFAYVSGRSVTHTTAGGEAITGRDMIALLATVGIDLGLLALTIVNPPREPPPVRPSGALVRHIREAIDTAIARAPNADIEWVRSHFIHHNKASYLVIPNLYSCDPTNEEESRKALAMNQFAGVLSDLDLVRWPDQAMRVGFGRWKVAVGRSELERLKADEMEASTTDLTTIRKDWVKRHGIATDEARDLEHVDPIRNHGVFSKAERALQFAGWSEPARRDIELFVLEASDGLTPLLMVLSDAGDAAGKAAAVGGGDHT